MSAWSTTPPTVEGPTWMRRVFEDGTRGSEQLVYLMRRPACFVVCRFGDMGATPLEDYAGRHEWQAVQGAKS